MKSPLSHELSPELSPEVRALKSQGVFKRLIKALRYSYQGFIAAWQHEAAFRTELVVFVAMVVAVCVLPLSLLQRGLLLGVALVTIVVELLNSAIEAVVDLASPDLHPLAGRAKDLGSAAVMLSMLITLATWVVVLWSVYR